MAARSGLLSRKRIIGPMRERKEFFAQTLFALRVAKRSASVLLGLPLLGLSLFLPEELSAKMVYRVFSSNGPVFMKLGQFLSTQRGVLPERICRELSVLQKEAPSKSDIDPKEAFWRETGMDVSRIGEIEKLVGTGCIARVYKVRGDGKDYALKILHPEVEKELESDLFIIETGSRLLGLQKFSREFSGMMQKQVDLRIEMNNALRMRRDFASDRNLHESDYTPRSALANFFFRETFIFPRPLLATRNLLLSEYWEGSPMEEGDKRALAYLTIKMLFHSGFVHSDLHPGNISLFEGPPRGMVVYDSGLAHSITETQKKNLRDLVKTLLADSPREALQMIVDRNPKNSRVSREAAERFVRDTADTWKRLREGCISLKTAAVECLMSSRRNRVELDEAYTNVILSALYVSTPPASWLWLSCRTGLTLDYLKILSHSLLSRIRRSPANSHCR
jgi:predicted unusual protein kinase regulating ubiquinone biosynthesis (AarF/ABC1/UbiB family)